MQNLWCQHQTFGCVVAVASEERQDRETQEPNRPDRTASTSSASSNSQQGRKRRAEGDDNFVAALDSIQKMHRNTMSEMLIQFADSQTVYANVYSNHAGFSKYYCTPALI